MIWKNRALLSCSCVAVLLLHFSVADALRSKEYLSSVSTAQLITARADS